MVYRFSRGKETCGDRNVRLTHEIKVVDPTCIPSRADPEEGVLK